MLATQLPPNQPYYCLLACVTRKLWHFMSSNIWCSPLIPWEIRCHICPILICKAHNQPKGSKHRSTKVSTNIYFYKLEIEIRKGCCDTPRQLSENNNGPIALELKLEIVVFKVSFSIYVNSSSVRSEEGEILELCLYFRTSSLQKIHLML